MYCNFLKAVDQERVMVLLSLNTSFFSSISKDYLVISVLMSLELEM